MVLALKPFGCMPSSQSDGVQSAVANHFKEMIFLPIETSGEGEINAHSRVQMALGEAKVKARMEFEQALKSTGKRLEDVKGYVAEHPELRNLFYPVPHVHGYAGVAANFVLHVNDLMNGKKRLARVPVHAAAEVGGGRGFRRLVGRLILSLEHSSGRKVTGPMPEVQVPEGTQAAPTYRLDVQLHELLMKPPEQPRLLPPPASGKEQKLPIPVFPQHPELMSARDEDFFPKNGRRKYKARYVYRQPKGWAFPFFRSRIMPGEFHPIIAYLFNEWKCNLDCHYCWAFDNSVRGMTEDVAKRSIDWLHDTGCRVLALMGGEPLLRPDFAHKICYYAAKKDFWIYLPTNGRLMRDGRNRQVGRRRRRHLQHRGGCLGHQARPAEGDGSHPLVLRLPGQEAVQVRLQRLPQHQHLS